MSTPTTPHLTVFVDLLDDDNTLQAEVTAVGCTATRIHPDKPWSRDHRVSRPEAAVRDLLTTWGVDEGGYFEMVP